MELVPATGATGRGREEGGIQKSALAKDNNASVCSVRMDSRREQLTWLSKGTESANPLAVYKKCVKKQTRMTSVRT